MSSFELKSNLSKDTQAELARIEAIDSGNRTTTETSFLTALAPYRTNRVLRWDNDLIKSPTQPDHTSTDNILEAEGNTLPTGYSGFKQGAIFYLLNRTGRNVYINTGSSTSAIWSVPGTEVASESKSASPSG